MCGLAGMVNLDGRPVARAELDRMSELLAHRGPAGAGVFLDGPVGFTHRRRAAAPAQPYETAALALALDGQLSNARAVAGRDATGVEAVALAFERRAMSCVDDLRGAFAWVCFDKRRRRLHLVRDRLGTKPLFVRREPARVSFASELSALARPGDVVSSEAVAGYFAHQYVPGPRTIYRDIEQLPPAHALEIQLDTGQITSRRYWTLQTDARRRHADELFDELNATLLECARLALEGAPSVGALLDGGLESALVAALTSRERPGRARAYAHAETAEGFARALGADLRHAHAPTLDAGLLDRLAQRFGQPFAVPAVIRDHALARRAAEDVGVALSGAGGDTVFGGRPHYRALLAELERDPAGLGRLGGLGARLLRRLPPRFESWTRERQATRLLHAPEPPASLLHRGVSAPAPLPLSGADVAPDIDPLTWVQAHELFGDVVDELLTRLDRVSADVGLDLRAPLLDHKLVELAFRVPRELELRKRSDGTVETEVLLRRAAGRYFGPELLERTAPSVEPPVAAWCRGPLRERVETLLRSPASRVFDWVRFPTIRRALDAFYGRGDDGALVTIWDAFIFELWARHAG